MKDAKDLEAVHPGAALYRPAAQKARVYVAGPMSGRPDLNYPAFNAAAGLLRGLGYQVENPAENPEPDPPTWEGYMRMAIAQLIRCDSIFLLPGWRSSRGACIEEKLARDLGLTIVEK